MPAQAAGYAIGDAIRWREGLVMMLGTAAGGYVGARLVRRLPDAWLRVGVIAIGLAISALFLRDVWTS